MPTHRKIKHQSARPDEIFGRADWFVEVGFMSARERKAALNKAARDFVALGNGWAKAKPIDTNYLRSCFREQAETWRELLAYREGRAKKVMEVTFDGDWSYEVGFVIEPDELAMLGRGLAEEVSFSASELVAFGRQLKRYAQDEAKCIKLWEEILKEENLL